MNETDFQATLKRDGFDEIITRELAQGSHVGGHAHPYDVRALVLDGEITLTVDGVAQVYRKGDIFTMAAGCRHEESAGAAGVRFLAGRRHATSAAATESNLPPSR